MPQRFGKIWLLLLMGVVLGLASCTEIIDVELDSTYTRLVVYGEITTDSVHHQVSLTKSSDYFSNKPPPPVSDAVVELEFDNQIVELEEHDTIAGVYLTPSAFRGVPGTKYNLRIRQVDIDEDGNDETYQSESIMPGGAELDSISLGYFTSPFVTGYQVFMYALDPPTQDWYGFKIWKNSDLLTDTLIKHSVQSDDFFNDSYLFGLPVGFLSDEDPREALLPGDTITLELNCIEQPYYQFILDAQSAIMGNNPLFSGPPANVSTNIDNGGVGYFTAFSVLRASAILPLDP